MERITYALPRRFDYGTSYIDTYIRYDSALLMSENHPRKNGVYLSGGPFYMTRSENGFIPVILKWRVNGADRQYVAYSGPNMSIVPTYSTASQLESKRLNDMTASLPFGAQGWRRTRPGNPVANVSTFIGEAREFVPNLPRRLYNAVGSLLARKQAAKRQGGFSGLGDAWLNVHFGWIPLLSDIRKMYELHQTLDKRLAQIVRDNGNGIRRQTTLRDSTTTTVEIDTSTTSIFGGWWQSVPGLSTGSSRFVRSTTVTDKIWYSARYRYYIPDIGSSEWTKKATRALYGVNVTPEVVWNLLPWSWLIDWFTNIGDIVSNASSNAVDNLTADYAYVMRTQETVTNYEGWSVVNGTGTPASSTYIPAGHYSSYGFNRSITKSRSAASPFGFGTTFNGLSSYQLGIVAALGISRWD
jgi:hypothetical protein